MKKLLAILLALMLVMVSVAALATDPIDDGGDTNTPAGDTGNGDNTGDTAGGTGTGSATNGQGDLSDYVDEAEVSIAAPATSYTIPKAIKIRGSADASVPADAAFSFTVGNVSTTAKKSNGESFGPTELPVSITNATIAEGQTDAIDLTLTLPTYPVPGVFEYEITENSSNFAGMTYAEGLKLKVTVIYNTTSKQLEVAGIAIRQTVDGDAIKTDEIENEYAAGNMTVKKTVAGNFGDRNKKFPITITFTADRNVGSISTYTYNGTEKTVAWNGGKTATVEIELADGESVEIKNLPEGVTYTVEEGVTDDNRLTDSKEKFDNPEAYKVAGEVEDVDLDVAGDNEVEITNTKDIEPDTGIVLDSLPYVLLMVLAAAGFAMMNARKREDY